MTNEMKTGLDLTAVAGGIGAWMAILPDIAALLSIAWLALRIWETETIKRLTAEKASQKDEIEKLNNEIDSLKGVRAAAVAEGAESAAAEGVSSEPADDASQQTDKAEN